MRFLITKTERSNRLVAILVLSSLFLSEPSYAWWGRGICRAAYGSFTQFRQELREQGWIRLALKDLPKGPEGNPFWDDYTPPKNLGARAVAAFWNFNPIGGTVHHLFKRPVRAVTRYRGKEKDPSAFLLIPTTLAAGITYGLLQNKAAEAGMAMDLEGDIQGKDAPMWDDRIANDVAYIDIKKLLHEKKISPEKARTRAYNRYNYINRYNEYLTAHPQIVSEMPEAFLDNALFADIKQLAETGIPVPKGYRKLEGFSPLPSLEQIRALAELRHTLYAHYNLIQLWVEKNPALDEMRKKSEDLNSLMEELVNDSFTKELVKARDEGKLTDLQLIQRMKEDVYWRVEFAEREVLRLEKMLKTGPDEYSPTEVVELGHIQQNTRDEIGIKN